MSDAMPVFYGLRLWWHESLGSQRSAATLRWRKRNAEQKVECNCGEPGEVKVYADQWSVVGSVQPFWWRCADHASVPLTTPWAGARPLWHQTRDECSWASSSTQTRIISDCGCGTHVGEPLL